MDVSDLPPPVAALRDGLVAAGFAVISDVRGSMGGADIVLSGSVAGWSGDVPAHVNLNADRGRWSVSLRFGAMSRWITAAAWRSYLDGTPMRLEELEEQASFVGDRLREMADAYGTDPDAEATLVRIGREFMRRRLGG